MPTYILVDAQGGWDTVNDLTEKSGYPVFCKDQNQIGGKQVPPKFVQIEITDYDDYLSVQDSYLREWEKIIDWEIFDSNFETDVHQIRVFVRPDLVSASGYNQLTRMQVENFLNRWNAIVSGLAFNEVTFEGGIYNAIASIGFWDKDVSNVVFTEEFYESSTGMHRIEANYGATPWPSDAVEERVVENGGIITKHPTNKITFEINRQNVFQKFKQDIKARVDCEYSVRRFRVLPQHVQMALDNAGTLSIDYQQFVQYIRNRLDD